MPFFTIILAAIAIIIFFILSRPAIRRRELWRATITPLASIIGSGFLIAAPLLNHLSGPYAVWVMATLCIFAYAIGHIIRWNIYDVEPLLVAQSNSKLLRIEQLSGISLVFAYILSVTYYLYLFASFIHRILPLDIPLLTKMITSIILLCMAIFGFLKGFRLLEKIEIFAVNIKLSIVIVFLLALLVFNLNQESPENQAFIFDMKHIPIVMGLLIMVQGFETSRYLGNVYSAPLRVRSMKIAQWLSTAIYITFILLFTLVFKLHPLTGEISDTSVIDVAQYVFVGASFFLLIAAATSQLSAALADFAGNACLLNEISGKFIPVKSAYLLITIACLVLVWRFNIFEIISLASKGFAIYYFFQCLSAMIVHYQKNRFKFYFSLFIAVLCALIVIFGQSFES